MTLNVFDFDDTLFRIPAHTTDINFDLKGNVHTWYDDPVSLDFTKHRVQLIQSVADSMKLDECRNIIITRRIPEMLPSILALLKHYDLTLVDRVYTIGHKGNKYKTLEQHCYDSRGVYGEPLFEWINIFEDSLFQVLEYQQNLNPAIEQNTGYYFVDKTHLIDLGRLNAQPLGKLKLSENGKTVRQGEK